MKNMKRKLISVLTAAAMLEVLVSCGVKSDGSGAVSALPVQEAPADESNVIYTEEANQAKEDEQENAKKGMELNDESAVIYTDDAKQAKEDEQENANEGIGMNLYEDMIKELPPEGYDKKREGIEYPEFKKYSYYSRTAERETNVNVLLPVNYDESREYPVLYILHGFYDNEDWMARDVVALSTVLTNLQHDGEAKEMIVVLPYIFCDKDMPYCTGMDMANCLAYDNFINDLTSDLMPFIEETFSVSKNRENTAITGFSMGGRESLFIGIKHPELFGYIGAVCPAPGLVNIPGSAMHPGQLESSEMRFSEENKPYVLLISSSKADGVVTGSPDSYRNILTENGEMYLSHIMKNTGHDHTSVKPHLYNYFRMIFKSPKSDTQK